MFCDQVCIDEAVGSKAVVYEFFQFAPQLPLLHDNMTCGTKDLWQLGRKDSDLK